MTPRKAMTPSYDVNVLTNDAMMTSCRPAERYVISQKTAIVRDRCPVLGTTCIHGRIEETNKTEQQSGNNLMTVRRFDRLT